MADLPVTPLADYGSLISSQPLANSAIATQTAQQQAIKAQVPLLGAQANLAQQQAAQVQQQTQYAQWRLGILTGQSGNSGPINTSGMTPTSGQPEWDAAGVQPSATGDGAGGAPTPATGVQPGANPTPAGVNAAGGGAGNSPGVMDVDEAVANHTPAIASAAQKYAVPENYTPQEKQQLAMAQHIAPADPAAANAITATEAKNHDARLATLRANAQLAASQAFDHDRAVAYDSDGVSPNPHPLETLKFINPQAVDQIQALAKKNNWTPAQTDDYTRQMAIQTANQVHIYSGRDIDTSNADGIPRDKATGMQMPGALPAGVSPAVYSGLVKDAHAPTTRKNSDGTETTQEQWQWDHYPSASAWANNAANAKANAAPGAAAPTGATPHGAVHSLINAVTSPASTQQAGTTGATSTQTTGAAPSAAPTTAAAPGGATAPQPGAKAGPDVLPGVDINSIPKQQTGAPTGPVVSGTSMTPGAEATAKAQADANVATSTAAKKEYAAQALQAGKNTAVYTQLSKQLENANPDFYGPRSKTATALANFQTYLTGKTPDSLVSQTEIDKYLTQQGVLGAKNLLGAGQQLRQQELLLLISQANPNIHQPLDAIKHLVAFGTANNEYDRKMANTGLAAIRAGADPTAIPSAFETPGNSRSDYVQSRMQQLTGTDLNALQKPAAPPVPRPGQSAASPITLNPATAVRDYGALPHGAHYFAPGDPPGQWRTKP